MTLLYTVSEGSMWCKQSTKGGRCIRKRTKEVFVETQSFLVDSARNEANVLKPFVKFLFPLSTSLQNYDISSRSSLQSVYLILFL